MVFLGKNLIMNIVATMGYCIEVVGKEGQGAGIAWKMSPLEVPRIIGLSYGAAPLTKVEIPLKPS